MAEETKQELQSPDSFYFIANNNDESSTGTLDYTMDEELEKDLIAAIECHHCEYLYDDDQQLVQRKEDRQCFKLPFHWLVTLLDNLVED